MIWHSSLPTYRAGWLRLWRRGPGISWTQEAPLFSERIGLRKPFAVVRGWRFHWLRGLA